MTKHTTKLLVFWVLVLLPLIGIGGNSPTMVDRDIVIHVTPPEPISGKWEPLNELLGKYESIGFERYKETSGIFYQYLAIGKNAGRFVYIENLMKEVSLECDFKSNAIQPHTGFYEINMSNCNQKGDYSLLVTPQVTLLEKGPFPINADLNVSLLININSSVVEMSSHRMKKMNKSTIVQALEKLHNHVNNNSANQ
jgi:hypothetical protein